MHNCHTLHEAPHKVAHLNRRIAKTAAMQDEENQSLARASACLERPRWRLAFGRCNKQVWNSCLQGNRELLKNSYRWVLKPPLQAADISSVDSGVHRKRLLRKLAADAEASDVSGHQGLRLHRRKRPVVGLLNHGQ